MALDPPRLSNTTEEILSTAASDLWRSLLPVKRSVFGSVEFVSIMERHLGYKGRLFVFAANEESIVLPLLLRPISPLSFAPSTHPERWDAVTPDYTGPLAQKTVSPTAARDFREHLVECCRKEQIVTLFAHLHPWNWSPDTLDAESVYLDRELVYIDLNLSEGQIWHKCLDRHCRKNINKALREHVRVFEVATVENIKEFHRIYIQTMERKGILDRYYLPLEYFLDFFETMSDNARFSLAEYNGQIIAGLLCLYDDVDVYAYRAGLDYNFQHVRPNNILYHDAILWARSQGRKRLVLGGGAKPDDGIFRFKTSFSPLRAKFRIYRHICNLDDYAALCRDWSTYYQSSIDTTDYFPLYRTVPS
jgi:serine/alanine adding enzyme